MWAICCSRLAPIRLVPFSYFWTCWNVRLRASPSFSWLMLSIIRRMRTREPTCLSVGLGAFLAIDFSCAPILCVVVTCECVKAMREISVIGKLSVNKLSILQFSHDEKVIGACRTMRVQVAQSAQQLSYG